MPTPEPDDPPAIPESAASDTERRFPCEECGAILRFSPGVGRLKCDYCGHENAIPQSAADIRENDFLRALEQLTDEADTEAQTIVKCEACGAEVEKPGHVTSLECAFCGITITTTGVTKRLIKPQALLPFRVTREEGLAHFRQWLRKLWFAPNALKKYYRSETKLSGIYTPYWTYDCRTTTWYTGMRGTHYYVTVGSGKSRRVERRTSWAPASGTVWNRFNDVLILGSESLPRRYADELRPWDLEQLTPYQDEYLSGFVSESYTVDLATGFKVAKQVMAPVIEQTIRADIGGDEQMIQSSHSEYHAITYKHILLPVWISAYRYRERVFRYLVNGRTGEVQGERPYSAWKIAGAVLAGLIVVGGIVWIVLANQ
ncbi:MAG: hypothetical protein KDA32_06260 [Phycisphaerales bacterium]|nr:hypothetical protein [Phycisphaerales bacterium]